MAAAPKQNLGMFPCPNCKRPTALKLALTGKLSFQCQHRGCEVSGFGEKHAGGGDWIEQVEKPTTQEAAAKPEPIKTTPAAAKAAGPVPVVPAAPTAPPRPAFDLGAL